MKTITLPEKRIKKLREAYTYIKADYIASILSESDLQSIDNTRGMTQEDYIFVARAKRIVEVEKKQQLRDKYDPMRRADPHHYNTLERYWLEHEEIALKKRLGREPTAREFAEDFEENKNGERFKIFYCLKFPEKVEKKIKI